MDLEQIMQQNTFVVAGNTLDPEKYVYRIKDGLIRQGYTVYAVGKELSSINEVPEEIDILDLCIHPAKGIGLLRECRKSVKCVVIQPGAESEEIFQYLKENHIPYIEGCLLVGMRLYPRLNRA